MRGPDPRKEIFDQIKKHIGVFPGHRLVELLDLVDDEVKDRARDQVGDDGVRTSKAERILEGATVEYGHLTVEMVPNNIVTVKAGEYSTEIDISDLPQNNIQEQHELVERLDRALLEIPATEGS